MKRLVSVVLILLGLALGYYGYQDLDDSSTSVEIGELEIKAEDNASKNRAYILLGSGVLSFVLGVYLLSRAKSGSS